MRFAFFCFIPYHKPPCSTLEVEDDEEMEKERERERERERPDERKRVFWACLPPPLFGRDGEWREWWWWAPLETERREEELGVLLFL